MSMNPSEITIFWYGRCCFLVEANGKRILFDPYDRYVDVDIGTIDADAVIISSTWHDHGHIGASPKAHVYSYAGEYEKSGLMKITGIEAKEERGSPTVVFNVRIGDFSITNFADLGSGQEEDFDKSLTASQRKALSETNIAFIRPSIETEGVNIEGGNIHNEIALNYCEPAIIFPAHYFPEKFTSEQVKKEDFIDPNIVIVNEMIEEFGYPPREIDGFSVSIKSSDLSEKRLYKFSELPPQVKYSPFVK